MYRIYVNKFVLGLDLPRKKRTVSGDSPLKSNPPSSPYPAVDLAALSTVFIVPFHTSAMVQSLPYVDLSSSDITSSIVLPGRLVTYDVAPRSLIMLEKLSTTLIQKLIFSFSGELGEGLFSGSTPIIAHISFNAGCARKVFI